MKLQYLRDVGGTGSLHPCHKDDPGAKPYAPAYGRFGMTEYEQKLDDARLEIGRANKEIKKLRNALDKRDSEIRRLRNG